MQFLRDIHPYVQEFESKNKGEIYRFLDFLEEKYSGFQPKPAVPGTPKTVSIQATTTKNKGNFFGWVTKLFHKPKKE